MNCYSASVALLWTTAMRCTAPATEAQNCTPSRRPILPLAKSRFAWAMRSGVSMTTGPANRIGPSAGAPPSGTTPSLHTPGSRSP